MLRQLYLIPLLVIPVTTLVFGLRNGLIRAEWLTGPEKDVGLASVDRFRLSTSGEGKSYDISVQLPADYKKADQAFPIVYSVHDGAYLINYDSIVAPLLRHSQMPDVIVVNVRPALPEGRAKGRASPVENMARSSAWANDLTLSGQEFSGGTTIGGQATVFADFFEKELIPHIESAYRCVPGDRCLAGFDVGALFAVETALTRPHLFTRLLVLAPASWADGATIRLAQERVASGFDPSLRMYLAIGSADNPAFVASFEQLSAVFESKKFEQLRIKSRILTDRRHANVVAPAAREGLKFVYSDLR